MKRIIILLVSLGMLAGCGAEQLPESGAEMLEYNREDLLNELAQNGIEPAGIEIFSYADNEAMEAAASEYYPLDPYPLIDFIYPPRLYKKGAIIVRYIGADDEILAFLEGVFGPVFAGADFEYVDFDISDLKQILEHRAVGYTHEDSYQCGIFKRTADYYLLDFWFTNTEERIDVYTYKSGKDMEADAACVGRSGSSFDFPHESIEVSWASHPHFYKKGFTIVHYNGENEEFVQFLGAYMEKFAG